MSVYLWASICYTGKKFSFSSRSFLFLQHDINRFHEHENFFSYIIFFSLAWGNISRVFIFSSSSLSLKITLWRQREWQWLLRVCNKRMNESFLSRSKHTQSETHRKAPRKGRLMLFLTVWMWWKTKARRLMLCWYIERASVVEWLDVVFRIIKNH